jgi:hypothetical protein
VSRSSEPCLSGRSLDEPIYWGRRELSRGGWRERRGREGRGEGRGGGRRGRARHAQHEHALRTSTGSRGSRKREYLGQYRCPCAPACPACVPCVPLPAPPVVFLPVPVTVLYTGKCFRPATLVCTRSSDGVARALCRIAPVGGDKSECECCPRTATPCCCGATCATA